MFRLIIMILVTYSHCVERSLKSIAIGSKYMYEEAAPEDYSECYDIKTVPRSFHHALEDCTADGHVLAYLNYSLSMKDDPISWLLDEQSKPSNYKHLSKMWLAVVTTDDRWLYTTVDPVPSSKIAYKMALQRVGLTYKDVVNFQSLATVMHTTASYACYTCGHHSVKCQRGAVYHEGHCYWLGSPDPVLYIQNLARCQSQGGIPIHAKDKLVNGFLVALQSSYDIKGMWLGLHKIEPGLNWYYSDDQPFTFSKEGYDQLNFYCLSVSFKEDNQHVASCTYIDSTSAYLWKCALCKKKQLPGFCTSIENPCEGENSYFHMGQCYSNVQHGSDNCRKNNFKPACPVGSKYFEEKETNSYRFQYLKARVCSENDLMCLEMLDAIQEMCGCVAEVISRTTNYHFMFIIISVV